MSDPTDDRAVDPSFCYRCGDRLDRIYHRHAGPGDYCDRRDVDPITVDDWAWGFVAGAWSSLGDGDARPRYLPADAAAALIRAVLKARHADGSALSDAVVDALVRAAP